MMLRDKNAVIYGAGGAIGSAVARAFASEGASVFLAGRRLERVQPVADEIARAGGHAEAAQVDARDEGAVDRHARDVAKKARRIDIMFDAIGMDDIQGTPLIDMARADFMQPVIAAASTKFTTARAVARQMVRQGSGVMMTITAEPTPAAEMGGFMAACAAVEALWRGLALELGPRGVRLIVIRSAGSPDAPGVQEVVGVHARNEHAGVADYEAGLASRTMLRRLPKVAEVADVASLLASDRASAMTATIANVTCGAFFDL
jgi:NAD(P)-dependent dehydrogenase (short-subunit alcohol dehydrogenase family)